MPDLISLRLFVRACELGSLSRVAEAHNIALAAVSRRIALLEAHYGVTLLTRNGRGVAPTPAGAVLLTRARDILRQVALTQSDLADYAKGLRGSVILWASTSAITQQLPDDLALFASANPDIRLDIREAYTADIADGLRAGMAEVGVVMSGPSIAGLEARPYRHDQLAIVAPAGFQLDKQSMRFSELADEDFVAMEDNTATTRLLQAKAGESGFLLRLRVQVDSFDAVCRMVQSGFGIGVLPLASARHFVEGLDLRLITLDEEWAERQMMICTSPLGNANAAATRLAEFLVDAAQRDGNV